MMNGNSIIKFQLILHSALIQPYQKCVNDWFSVILELAS